MLLLGLFIKVKHAFTIRKFFVPNETTKNEVGCDIRKINA